MNNDLALVLGGGGSTANAWEIGVVAGLFDSGVDLTTPDLIIGTSAGSTVGAQLLAATPTALLERILVGEARPRTAVPTPAGHQDAQLRAADQLERMSRIIDSAADPADYRRRLGAAALEADADPGGEQRCAEQRAVVAARLPGLDWPRQDLRIVAVNAHTGEPIVFDRDSGVELVDAVTASCAGSGSPHRIGEQRYIDGGFRRNENADLATGRARVIVFSPFSGRSLVPARWRMNLAVQVDELRGHGSLVEMVVPDSASRGAMGDGPSVMDPARRAPAARAGYDQGRALAQGGSAVWP